MFRKTLLATAAVVGLAGAAQAQQPLFAPSVDSFCVRSDLLPVQQVACSSPRLRAGWQRNMQAGLELAAKLNPADQAELVSRIKARGVEHALYCRIAPDRPPQLPISKATEDCLAGWQDWTHAEMQRGLQILAQTQAGQAIRGFFQGLAQGLDEMARNQRAMTPQYVAPPVYMGPQSCMTQPNGSGWSTSCQ
jgi:hypothetical protein